MEHLDEGQIHAWLDDALPAADATAVARHVASCEACAAAVAEARGLIAASSRIISALDDVPGGVIPRETPLPKSVGAEVTSIADAASRNASRTPARSSGPSWWRRSGIAAAALLFVASGSVLVTKNGAGDEMLSMDSAAAAAPGGPSAPGTEQAPPRVTNQALELQAPREVAAAGAAVGNAATDSAARGAAPQDMVASNRELSRDVPRPQMAMSTPTMSAPASSPAAAPPPAPTSPVIAASPPVVSSSSFSGAGAASAKTTTGAVAATAVPPAADARAFRDESRRDAARAAPTARAEPTAAAEADSRNTMVSPFVGCYAVNGAMAASRQRASAEAAREAPARLRLNDTAVAGTGRWLTARSLDPPSAPATLQWRPMTRDEVQLRTIVAAETTTVRVKIGSGAESGVARRVGC